MGIPRSAQIGRHGRYEVKGLKYVSVVTFPHTSNLVIGIEITLEDMFTRARIAIASGAAGASLLAGFYDSACSQSDAHGTHARLTSVLGNFHVDQWSTNETLAKTDPAKPWWVRKRTLHGGRQEGVDEIEVHNGVLSFTVLPTRGMSIGNMRVDGEDLSWSSPIMEAVHPREIDLQDRSGLGWLTGFNEWLVRCGVAWSGHPGTDGGHLLTLHGRIGNIPASEVEVVVDEDAPHRIRVRGRVDEAMFKFCDFELWTEISTVPGSSEVSIRDVLKNRSSYEKEYMMIYHTQFGPPILEEGSQFVCDPNASVFPFNADAAAEMNKWQSYRGPTKGYGETVYCVTPSKSEDGSSHVALVNATRSKGVKLRYGAESLPHLNLWKNTDTELEGYVTGLEPGTNFAYNRSKEREAGRVRTLQPSEEVSFELDFIFLRSNAEVQAASKEVTGVA